MSQQPDIAQWTAKLRARERSVGSFVKTPSHQVVEILGAAGLDFLVLDAEHAPFGPSELDLCLLAARAAGVPAAVRVRDGGPGALLQALDLGAAGVVVPHVRDPQEALAALRWSRYGPDGRGFSNSPRAGGYGAAGMAEHVARSNAALAVICQIEDRPAVEAVAEIAAVEGIAGLLIGRADLAVAYGAESVSDPKVIAAAETICAAATAVGRAVGLFLPDLAEVARWQDAGASFFIVGSDQSLLRQGALRLAHDFANTKGQS